MMKSTRDQIALILAATVSVVLLCSAVKILLYAPSEIPEGARASLENVISLIIGALVGFISSKTNSTQ